LDVHEKLVNRGVGGENKEIIFAAEIAEEAEEFIVGKIAGRIRFHAFQSKGREAMEFFEMIQIMHAL
jgi:hypothetical protein